MGALRTGGPTVFIVAAAAGLAVALAVLGDAAALPPSAQQAAGGAGAAAGLGWGLPALTLVALLAGFTLLGALLTAAWCGAGRPAAARGMTLAGACGAVLTVAGVAGAVTAFVADSALAPSDAQFSAALGRFLLETGLGRSWLVAVVAAASVTALCFAVRSRAGALLLALASLVALVPLAAQQFAVHSPGRQVGVPAAAALLLALGAWFGSGLALLVVQPGDLRRRLREQGTFALICCVAAVPAGAILTQVRIGGDFASPPGMLTAVLAACLAVLAVLVTLRRRMTAGPQDRARQGPGALPDAVAALLLAETAMAGIAVAMLVSLGYAGSPTGADAATTGTSPAQILTGNPLPPPGLALSPAAVRPDAFWLLAILGAGACYLAGMRALARRGYRWPARRAVSWFAGLAVLLVITNGAPALYQRYLFSVHLGVAAAAALLVPALLVPGSPLLLAFTVARAAGRAGAYRVLAAFVRSRPARLSARPVFSAAVLVASLWVWLTSDVLRWSVTSLAGRELSLAWLLAAGYAFTQTMVGRDPAAYHAAFPVRLLVLGGVLAAHIALGLTVGLRSGLWAADWFAAMGRTWGLGAVADQQAGGWVFLAFAVVVALALTVGIVAAWTAAPAPSGAPGAPGGPGTRISPRRRSSATRPAGS